MVDRVWIAQQKNASCRWSEYRKFSDARTLQQQRHRQTQDSSFHTFSSSLHNGTDLYPQNDQRSFRQAKGIAEKHSPLKRLGNCLEDTMLLESLRTKRSGSMRCFPGSACTAHAMNHSGPQVQRSRRYQPLLIVAFVFFPKQLFVSLGYIFSAATSDSNKG